MSPPAARRRSPWLILAFTLGSVAVLVAGLGFAVLLAGGTSPVPGRALPGATSSGSAPSGSAPSGPAPSATTSSTATAQPGGELSVEVAVGECITLSSIDDRGDTRAKAEPAACGSATANYKVVGKAATQEECVPDADATYDEPAASGAGGAALCLDVDWVPGDCYDVSGSDPARVPCAASGPGDVQVQQILRGTVDEGECEQQAYPYADRIQEVCLAEPVTS